MKTKYVFSALCFSLLFFCSFAHAVAVSDTSATLTLDWDTYSSVVEWQTADYSDYGTDANLDGVTDSNYSLIDGWQLNPVFTETAQVTADSVGTATNTYTSATTIAHSRADGIGTTTPPVENVISSATSHRGKVFSPITDGEITFSFAYTMSQIFNQDFATEVLSGWSIAEINLSLGGTNMGHDEAILNNTGTTETGFLTYTDYFYADSYYYLEGHVYTSASANSPEQAAPIPEPSTMLLLSSGIMGLVWYGRKRKRA